MTGRITGRKITSRNPKDGLEPKLMQSFHYIATDEYLVGHLDSSLLQNTQRWNEIILLFLCEVGRGDGRLVLRTSPAFIFSAQTRPNLNPADTPHLHARLKPICSLQ